MTLLIANTIIIVLLSFLLVIGWYHLSRVKVRVYPEAPFFKGTVSKGRFYHLMNRYLSIDSDYILQQGYIEGSVYRRDVKHLVHMKTVSRVERIK